VTFAFTSFFIVTGRPRRSEAMKKSVTNPKGAGIRRLWRFPGTATGTGNESGVVPHGFGTVRFRSVLA
jgi:hypothetical protein